MSRLAEYREKSNLTQEELSKKSGVSVRTIQRIESGVTPKGYTLKALAKALDLQEEALIKKEVTAQQINYKLVNIINLSSLIVVFIPIANFIVPLLIAIIKKQLNPLSKQIITIQIFWSLVMIILFLLGNIINLGSIGNDIIIGFILLTMVANVIMILRNSMELNKNGKLFFNPKTSII